MNDLNMIVWSFENVNKKIFGAGIEKLLTIILQSFVGHGALTKQR